jgi:hypothetical protein
MVFHPHWLSVAACRKQTTSAEKAIAVPVAEQHARQV